MIKKTQAVPVMPVIDPSTIKISRKKSGVSVSTPDVSVGVVPPCENKLIDALWRSVDKVHQVGVLDRKTKKFRNVPVKDANEAVQRVQVLSSEGSDTYFACAEYDTPDSRKAANVSGAYGFWMDIDCGVEKDAAGKGYRTIEKAEEAMKCFCKETGIPAPTHIVNSGGGLHLYWVLDILVDTEVWQSHAAKLKVLTNTLGFLADNSRTADIASVLRIPGTLNYKYEPPRPVILKYASDEFVEQKAMLTSIDSAHSKLCNTPKSQASVSDSNDEIDNKEMSKSVEPDMDRLASALAVLDPDCDEETWKLRRIAPLARLALDSPQDSDRFHALAKKWSSGELGEKPSKAWITPGKNNRLTGEEAFEKEWKRFFTDNYSGRHTTVGTIFHDAKQLGWCDKVNLKDSFTKLSQETETEKDSSENDCQHDPLAVIQDKFCLINFNGKLWILDKHQLKKRSKYGVNTKLVLSNRSDGKLLVGRELKAQFPEVDAGKFFNKFEVSPDTRCYHGVEFNPIGSNDNYLNLWSGPTLIAKSGKWVLIRSFLLNVICDGDIESYQYLIRYFAHALQHPKDKPGVMIILLGGQGVGKGTLGRILQKIWSATYLQVSNVDAVTGNFNASLEQSYIVFMDEALFSGDRRAADALKSLVTEPLIHINEKHQPARQMESYHRFFAATNADHFKNTESDDRRDFVLRVSEKYKGDHQYWKALHDEIEVATLNRTHNLRYLKPN